MEVGLIPLCALTPATNCIAEVILCVSGNVNSLAKLTKTGSGGTPGIG